jgi:hypothetical protein
LLRTFGTLAVVGGAALTLGVFVADLGTLASLPDLQSVGFVLSAAGLGLIFLPVDLREIRVGGAGFFANVGAACQAGDTCLASLVDVPSVLDPTNFEAGVRSGLRGWCCSRSGSWPGFVAVSRAGILGVGKGSSSCWPGCGFF